MNAYAGAASLAVLALFFSGCDRHVRVVKEMIWECAPERYMREYPDAQPVRFRFVENPHHEVVTSGRGLCDQLEASGKKVVSVEFDVFGNRWNGLHGFNDVAVDGRAIVDVGGWGSSGSHSNGPGDPAGPHPFEALFR